MRGPLQSSRANYTRPPISMTTNGVDRAIDGGLGISSFARPCWQSQNGRALRTHGFVPVTPGTRHACWYVDMDWLWFG